MQHPKLRPFAAHIDRGDGKPMIVIEGRILAREQGEVFCISAFGSQATLLPLQIESDAHGEFARVSEGDRKFDNGLCWACASVMPASPPGVELLVHSSHPPCPAPVRCSEGWEAIRG